MLKFVMMTFDCFQIVLTCGPSEDPDDYNVIDSLKVYAKTKETFGWPPEDNTTG